LTGIGKYTGEMADWLVDNGYDCTVVTAFPYYPNWKIQAPYKGNFYKKEVLKDGKLVVYRCTLYVPAKPTGLKRIIHDASFYLSAFFMTLFLLFKEGNGHIFCMAPPFHLGFLAILYRFFKGGKIIYHIHDLQIEAARDLKVIKLDSAFSVLFALEKFIINKADYVSSISSGMINKVSKKTKKEIILFPNWVDTKLLHPTWSKKEDLKKRWGFEATDKIVLYSGSIGEKQGLESLVSIAKRLEGYSFIKIIICGNGPYKNKLKLMAKESQLNNLFFMPLQPLNEFNNFLNMTDVHLVLQKKNACDLMMPSKLTAIWSSGGLALVTAEPGTTLFTVIKENNMGVVIDCENETLLMESILDCCTTDHSSENKNGREYAEKNLNKNNILEELMLQVNSSKPVATPVLVST
jgi:colanic acid biosynthesis glycosyl transferase WcaI